MRGFLKMLWNRLRNAFDYVKSDPLPIVFYGGAIGCVFVFSKGAHGVFLWLIAALILLVIGLILTVFTHVR